MGLLTTLSNFINEIRTRFERSQGAGFQDCPETRKQYEDEQEEEEEEARKRVPRTLGGRRLENLILLGQNTLIP